MVVNTVFSGCADHKEATDFMFSQSNCIANLSILKRQHLQLLAFKSSTLCWRGCHIWSFWSCKSVIIWGNRLPSSLSILFHQIDGWQSINWEDDEMEIFLENLLKNVLYRFDADLSLASLFLLQILYCSDVVYLPLQNLYSYALLFHCNINSALSVHLIL